MEDKNNILIKLREAEAECQEAWPTLYDEMEEDQYFAAGQQWHEADLNKLKEKHKITDPITINVVKKQVDTIVGRRIQTLTDLKAYAIELNDDIIADVLTRLLKWTLDAANANTSITAGYKNQVCSGLGWLQIIKGDNTKVVSVRTPDIYIDPLTTDILGLSDCDYVLKYKPTSKRALAKAFPAEKDDIEAIKDPSDNLYRHDTLTSKRKDKITVKEYWYRSEENRIWIVNTENPIDAEVWDGDEETLAYFLTINTHLTREERPTEVIRVATIAGNILLQDETYCTGDKFPFIPLVGFYTDSIDEWEYRIMGIVRNLKDIQREKNARRLAMFVHTQKLPLDLLTGEEGTITDINKIKEKGGMIGWLPYRRGGTPPALIPQPGLPASEVQLEQLLNVDVNQVGLAPEITGTPSSLESAKAISLVQAVGLTSVAEINSNLNYALRSMGSMVLKFILETYSKEKMQRIVGNGILITDEIYSALKDDIRYDIYVDETSRSITSQRAAHETLKAVVQYTGMGADMLIEYDPDLASEIKSNIMNKMKEQQQQAALQQQAMIAAQMPQQPGVI